MNTNTLKYSLEEDFNYYLVRRKGLNDNRFHNEKQTLIKLLDDTHINDFVQKRREFQNWIISGLR